jgi:hypothetical protein
LITVRSTASDRVLHIGDVEDVLFPVTLSGYPVTTRTQLWVEYDAPELAAFLQDMGRLERPWSGAKVWNSLEGDLRLSVTCSLLGAVTFDVTLSGAPGSPEAWSVTAGIQTGLGELERIGRESEGLRNAT